MVMIMKEKIKKIVFYVLPLFLFVIVNFGASSYNNNQSIKIGSDRFYTVDFIAKIITLLLFIIMWIFAHYFKIDNSQKRILTKAENGKIFLFSTAKFAVCIKLCWYMISIFLFWIFNGSPSDDVFNITNFFSSVLLAPIIEELLFRVHIIGATKNTHSFNSSRLGKKVVTVISWIICTLGFAYVHMMLQPFNGLNTVRFISLAVSGFLYGYAFYKTSNIIYPLLMHISNNLVNEVTGRYLMDSPVISLILAILFVLIAFFPFKTSNNKVSRGK